MFKPGSWINRKRHNRGFGIQSPSAFFFVTQVLKEKLPYYAYEELDAIAIECGGMNREACRRLFRIANVGEQHIEISGNVKLENVSVDINAIGKEDLVVSVNGSLCTKGSEYIELGRVEAHVDYQLEPVSETVSIASLVEGLGEKIDFSLDFNRVHLDVDLATNLTLPVALHELSLVPFHGGEAGEPMSILPGLPLSIFATDETFTLGSPIISPLKCCAILSAVTSISSFNL